MRWKTHWVCVTHTLAGECVGLEEVDDGLWDAYVGPVTPGRMDERRLQIEDHKGRRARKQVSPLSPAVHCHAVAHSADSTSACSSTVCVAFFCLSGG
jgi:hypothetical protein